MKTVKLENLNEVDYLLPTGRMRPIFEDESFATEQTLVVRIKLVTDFNNHLVNISVSKFTE